MGWVKKLIFRFLIYILKTTKVGITREDAILMLTVIINSKHNKATNESVKRLLEEL
jgi:hypothetical protein